MSILKLTIVDWLKQNFGDSNVEVHTVYRNFIMVEYKFYKFAVHVYDGAVICNGLRFELSDPSALCDIVEHIRISSKTWE